MSKLLLNPDVIIIHVHEVLSQSFCIYVHERRCSDVFSHHLYIFYSGEGWTLHLDYCNPASLLQSHRGLSHWAKNPADILQQFPFINDCFLSALRKLEGGGSHRTAFTTALCFS